MSVRAIASLMVLSGALGLAACGPSSHGQSEPIDHRGAALAVETNVRNGIVGFAEAIQFLQDSELLNDIFDSGDASAESPVDPYAEPPVDDVAADEDHGDGAEELLEWLMGHVFVEGNLEEESGTSVTYRLRPEIVCLEEATEWEPASIDEDCSRLLTEVEIRLLVTSPAEGDLDVALLVGAERDEPAVFHLYRASIGVTLDFGEARRAVQAIADAVGEPDPIDEGAAGADLEISELEGRVRFEIIKNGEQDYTAQITVVSDIRVAVAKDGESASFALASSAHTLWLRVDGAQKELAVSVDLGVAELQVPFAWVAGDLFDSGEVLEDGTEPAPARAFHGVLDVVLAGLEARATISEADRRLTISDIGLGEGTSYVAVDRSRLAALDLNAAAGRHFDLTISTDDAGLPTFEIDPSFDLLLALRFDAIADQLIEGDVPSFAMRDNLRMTLDGSNPTLRVVTVNDGEYERESVQVVSGELRITSSASPEASVTVEAGMCLESEDSVTVSDPYADVPPPAPSSDEHELLSSLTATEC